ncbi:hypothetical protein [Flavobacterium sp. '19STA2R22 D10 B1']|uniref:hypothetical protein n=1 Tax=Flavobacterium aerium TaxID=3037261 RepID=UPI00278C498A|nr:hypothetical protein [Flavobacterium sp. '19STA2R22 D10 B1']
MKKATFVLSFVLTFIFSTSCENTNDNLRTETLSKKTNSEFKLQGQKAFINPNMYGEYHNEAILLYSQTYISKGSHLSNSSFEQVLKDMLTLMKEKHPHEFLNVKIDLVAPYFKEYQSSLDYNFKSFWTANKISFKDSSMISNQIIHFIDDIILNDLDYGEIISKITTLEKENKLKQEDIKFLIGFKSVLNSSNDLWAVKENSLYNTRRNWCNHQLIISDAAAAGLFLWSGPIAAIAGAASSLITASTGDCN